MDHRNLLHHCQYIALNGNVLSIEERAALQSSLTLLKNENHFYKTVYWGKVTGTTNDYHIAQGYTGSILGKRTSFYSSDQGVSWNQIVSNIKSDDIQYIENIRGYFVGDPSYAYVIPKILTPEEKQKLEQQMQQKQLDEDGNEIEDEEKPKVEVQTVSIIEEKRLAYLIQSIDHDTSVVPRGVYLLKVNEEVVPNDLFTGLDKHQSGKLCNYLHMRKPENLALKDLLQKEHLSQSLDFADPIDEDAPNKCWCLQYDDSYSVVLGKSLLWPGYVFYHCPNTSVYGSYYVGNGCKNLDLCFMTA
ncbi:rsph9 [Acrasis kona]|uniref:Radial spoke head protein 9 homolog n=1 Tax=Acrasis kona TaxID=1008807 RepID=A0AAW2YH16_9EUKA